MKKQIFVTRPTLPPLEELLPYLEQIWESRTLTNNGPLHARLEAALCEYLGVSFVSLFNNGTVALVAALKALRITGEVITSPYSFVATAHSILWNGLTPVFVDVDPVTLNLDPAKIEEAITPRTTAIMPVHVYGTPCDTASIQSIADEHNLRVVYDAAHAFGVRHGPQSVMTYGDLSVLSFHATKVFNTFEGGAIISPDARTKSHIDRIKNFGFVDETTVTTTGINGKMSELNAAIGLAQLRYVDRDLEERQSVHESYERQLRDVPGISIYYGSHEATRNYSYFPIFVEADYPLTRDELYSTLRERDIFARRYFYPLITDFPMYRDPNAHSAQRFPHAWSAAERVLCLPIYPQLGEENIANIVRIIRQHSDPGRRAT